MSDHSQFTPQSRLIPLTQWPKIHCWPSLSGLRWLVFNEDNNGFSSVTRRVGRRVLLDEAEFFKWVEEKQGATPDKGSSG